MTAFFATIVMDIKYIFVLKFFAVSLQEMAFPLFYVEK